MSGAAHHLNTMSVVLSMTDAATTGMKLGSAVQLLGSDNARAFAEVYKIYEFKDEGLLRDYLDFVVHEPVEWMRGFPTKWKSESQFSRVRAAFHKLLKRKDVEDALGATYATEIHDAIWAAFKEHMATVVGERNKTAVLRNEVTTTATIDAESVRSDELPTLSLHDADAESVHSVKKPRTVAATQPSNLEARYNRLDRAFRALLGGEGDETSRLRQALLVMLDSTP